MEEQEIAAPVGQDHDSCEIESEGMGEKLGMTLVTVGQDVIVGLMDLLEFGIIDEPAPMCVANLPTAVRNKFHLEEGGRPPGLGERWTRRL